MVNQRLPEVLPVEELSVESNQFSDLAVRADMVERPFVKACWLFLILKVDLLS